MKLMKKVSIVIDSITAVCLMLGDKQAVRNFIFALGTSLNALNCTIMLTSEIEPDEGGYSVFGVEEFICDDLIKLQHLPRKDSTMRTMQLLKLREVEITSPLLYFHIKKEGIVVIPRFEMGLGREMSNRRLSTGIQELDKISIGGLWEGSTTLVSGTSGTGKSLFGLHFLREGLLHNEPSLLVIYEESLPQVYRNAAGFGWDLKKFVDNGLLTIIQSYPEDKQLDMHLMKIVNEIKKRKVKRLVVDSLSRIRGATTSEVEYTDFLKRLNAYLKRQQITSMFIYTSPGFIGGGIVGEETARSHIATITDAIILLKYVEIVGEIKRMVSLLKLRGSDHDKKLREFTIGKKGIVIGETFKGLESISTGIARSIPKQLQKKVQKFEKKIKGKFMEDLTDNIYSLQAEFLRGKLPEVNICLN